MAGSKADTGQNPGPGYSGWRKSGLRSLAGSIPLAVRKAIAEGRIYVRPGSLTRPRLGVSVCSPRHVHAADQKAEEEAYKRANPYWG